MNMTPFALDFDSKSVLVLDGHARSQNKTDSWVSVCALLEGCPLPMKRIQWIAKMYGRIYLHSLLRLVYCEERQPAILALPMLPRPIQASCGAMMSRLQYGNADLLLT